MAASSSSSAGGSPAHAPAAGGGGAYHHRSRFGDTTLTKVFVGGLAWETPSEGLREHFQGYGEILEAVVITDRETGRSKGYGFVIFRDPESAQQAVQNPNPVIAGRRANCNIASMGPPRSAQPRGRGGGAGRGPRLPDQPPMGPPYRVPSQMTPPHAAPVFYHPQHGYLYPHDYPYQQQALYNSQVLQHYYPQLYGPTSPLGQPYQYMGYMPDGPGPRTGFSPMQQPARPPFFQQPTAQAQVEGSFPPGTSLPPNFRLQLPPHAVSMQPDDASGFQSAESTSSTAATSTNNQEASRPLRSNSDPNTSN
ncbi:probable RNA-binding protein ARP1 isoform X3 [Phragmites australis]|uniref:probable RNA-binding protein ARP1 isoform X3 n=1 Tax=Phragmites australis TaxID=29695 RepID=UPI002D769156|nr:probable RNA-binding protein ARP1 isoform X3 [Phragmites australis]